MKEFDPNSEGPLLVAAISAGSRSRVYSNHALRFPERMKIVAVAEPNADRREAFAEAHTIAPGMCFSSYQELAARPRLAHAVINGTDDALHYPSTIALVNAGYHMLLEKPIARTEQELSEMIDAGRQRNRIIMICHVLRYSPFYRRVKQIVSDGRIGEIIGMHLSENVSYHHVATAFVRGRWNNTARSNPSLMSKCCHDLDIIAWMMPDCLPARVASFGSNFQFQSANAPAGSAARCLDGCEVEPGCHYSARTNYVVQGFGWGYPFENLRPGTRPTDDEKIAALRREDNRYGRCVWKCDNNVVDHQTVILQYPNGATASLNMLCGMCRPTRTIQILGTRGELEGDFERGQILLRSPSLNPGAGYTEEIIDVKAAGGAGQGGHGGGDKGIIADFVSVLRGEGGSQAVTRIEASAVSHYIAFAADTAMREQRVVEFEPSAARSFMKSSPRLEGSSVG